MNETESIEITKKKETSLVKEITLPTKKAEIQFKSPRLLLIYSKPKVGKTTLLTYLDNNLIVDTENGVGYTSAMSYQVKNIEDIIALGKEIIKQSKPYDYISIDTITSMETMCLPYALKLYRKTPMGATFAGDNVLTLPNGAGYLYLREAFTRAISFIKTWAPRIILVGHLKETMINTEGKEVNFMDVDLTGRLKAMTCGDADAIGYMYREGANTMLTFNSKDTVLCGSRPEHLRGKTVLLAEEQNNIITTHWNEIFID